MLDANTKGSKVAVCHEEQGPHTLFQLLIKECLGLTGQMEQGSIANCLYCFMQSNLTLILCVVTAQKTLKHRRVKHFGYEFCYDNNNVDKDKPLPGGENFPIKSYLFLTDI